MVLIASHKKVVRIYASYQMRRVFIPYFEMWRLCQTSFTLWEIQNKEIENEHSQNLIFINVSDSLSNFKHQNICMYEYTRFTNSNV